MSGGTTGGVFASPVWHSFMSVVHTDMNIPTIPGLQPHPVQVSEQQRIAAIHPEGAAAGSETQRTSSSLMSDQARDALRKTAAALRKAGGIAEPPPPATPNSTGSTPGAPPPPAPNKKADTTVPADHRRATLGVAQPPLDGTPARAVP
jgi:penicillin-binding protein 1A